MTRDQLEHLLRASARIAAERDVIVFGSQAILGSFDDTDLPDEAIGSIELDVCFRDDPDVQKADRVDDAIGELSAFHHSFGIYAQGIGITTAIVPPGWERRLVVYDTAGTEPGRGLCLEPHDLVASKLAAGRDKDYAFARALLREGLVDATTLLHRVGNLPIDDADRTHLTTWIDARA
ncbi:MAG TPA: hypothetical protein VGO78_26035 [Acidimicrobiales bacterium]|nr:hypothetical protein [Acidimicrobiales bacterium]